jgi:hypothetical protein
MTRGITRFQMNPATLAGDSINMTGLPPLRQGDGADPLTVLWLNNDPKTNVIVGLLVILSIPFGIGVNVSIA